MTQPVVMVDVMVDVMVEPKSAFLRNGSEGARCQGPASQTPGDARMRREWDPCIPPRFESMDDIATYRTDKPY